MENPEYPNEDIDEKIVDAVMARMKPYGVNLIIIESTPK